MRARLGFLFLSLLIGFAPAANTQGNPTLQETQEWISQNFDIVAKGDTICKNGAQQVRSNRNLSWSSCTLSWTLGMGGIQSGRLGCDFDARIREYSVNLRDLDPEKIDYDYVAFGSGLGVLTLNLHTRDRQKKVKRKDTLRISGQAQTTTPEEFLEEAYFYTTDENSIRGRMTSAFEHAIRLCGGTASKPEPF